MASSAKTRKALQDQAQQTAALSVSGDKSALQQALAQLVSDRDSAVQQAQSAGQAQQAAIRAAVPGARQVYADSRSRLTAGPGIQQAVGANGNPAAAGILAAAAAEQQTRLGNLENEKRQTLNNLSAQGTAAASGISSSVRAAQDTYASKASDILQQLLDLNDKEGSAAAAEYSKLVEAAKGRAVTTRGQDVTARGQDLSAQNQANALAETQRHNQTEEQIAQERADQTSGGKSGVKPLTAEQQNAAIDKINEVRTWVKNLGAAKGADPQKIHDTLVRGANLPQTKTNPDGTTTNITVHIPSYPDIYVQAAGELQKTGHISAGTAKTLRNRGFKIPDGWLAPKAKPGSNIAGQNSTGSGLVP